MRSIHSFLAICLLSFTFSRVAMSQGAPAPPLPKAPASSVPIAAPTAPTLKGSLINGDDTLTGVTQKPGPTGYPAVDVYICILTDKPKPGTPLVRCDQPGSPISAASLKNSTTVANAPDLVHADKNGNFTATLSNKLIAGEYVYVTQVATPAGVGVVPLFSLSAGYVVVASFSKTAPLGAAVGGLDVSGASSTDPRAVFLGTGIIDVPLSSQPMKGDFFNSFLWLTGQLRIAGMAQPKTLTGALGTTAAAASYLATAVNANPDSIVQSLEGSGSISFKIKHWELPVDSFDVGNYQSIPGASPSTFISLSGTISVGAITPLSASQANPPVYNLTNQIIEQYSSITFPANCGTSSSATSTSPCYVAFVPTDRTHFYRNYQAGIRLKLYAGDYKDNKYRFPGMADLSFGQNEYVTGGQLHHFVLHIGGVMPVPHADGVYIFGSMDTELNKSLKDNPQLILTPATSTSTIPITYASSSVTDIPVSQPNRDRYQIGFGIDIFHLINSLVKKSTTTPAGTTAGQ